MTKKSKKDRTDSRVGATEKENKEDRRAALTKIVATAGIAHSMSGNWSKPVLESVVLPAHARGTVNCCRPDDGGPNCVCCCDNDGELVPCCDGEPDGDCFFGSDEDGEIPACCSDGCTPEGLCDDGCLDLDGIDG